jgi:RNA polymerase sigma-70 factor (ECF subfamily)
MRGSGRAGRAAAEDLAQEAMLRGLRALPSLADAEKFGPWLIGIAVRTCLDWLKSAQRSEVSLDAIGARGVRSDEGSKPSSTFAMIAAADQSEPNDRRERAEELMREIERLPAGVSRGADVLLLPRVHVPASAEALGVSAATINARLTKARAMLRSRMMAEWE